MLIGAMNHPREDVLTEIGWMAEMGLDFIDLTLEPPCAASWQVDPGAIRTAIERAALDVVGHTAYYLPIACPIEPIRQAAVAELRRCIEIFAAVGARWMNIHPDSHAPMHDRAFFVERNRRSLEELLPTARECRVGLMLENVPGEFNSAAQLAPLLDPLSEVGLHLDIGHANLLVAESTADAMIRAYGERLRHVHLHDNKGGGADLHLPLGAGTIDIARHIRALKACGYDGTITLEVFTPDRHYLTYSRDALRRLWEMAGGRGA
jgi:sugar phosphate isomerase/epimerase